MADDKDRRKKADDLKKTEEEIKRLDAEKKRREDSKLIIEDVSTKSKIYSRPMIEDIPGKGKKPAPAEAEGAAPPVGEDLPFGRPKVEDTGLGGHVHHHHEDAAKGGYVDAAKGEDHGIGHQAEDALGHEGGQGHDGADAAAADAGAADGGGGDHVTGARRRNPPMTFYSNDIFGIMKEAVLRNWDSHLKAEGGTFGVEPGIMMQRQWAFEGIGEVLNERQLSDLKKIEDNTPDRIREIGRLNLQRAKGRLTADEGRRLRRLEDEEALRYWLREKFVRRAPLTQQQEIPWLRPLGPGADGVVPYTVLNSWDQLNPTARRAARWLADNMLLRYQNAIVAQFLPKKPSLSWFKEKAKKGLETLFDDWNEELYSDKKWKEMVKKGQAQLESLDEELTGYDQFTVEEEKKIASMLDAYLKSASSDAKEEEMYS